MSASQVILADDHPLFRSALRQAVAAALPGAQLWEADSMPALEQAAEQCPDADLVLLDLKMPGARGFSSLLFLRQQYPALPVMVVSAAEETSVVRRALDFGAAGYIPKSASIEAIGTAIQCVLAGELHFPTLDDGAEAEVQTELAERLASLTPQQLRVLQMLSDGALNKQIAFELAVTEATVKAHMTAILRKLGLNSRTQAALIAQQLDVDDTPREALG